MKTLWKMLTVLTMAIFISYTSFADARVQVIHNSADPAADIVDVWLNDILLIDNFKFRTATPFIDAPAGVEFTISIANPKSESAAEAIWSQDYTLADNETYVIIANGIVDAMGADVEKTFNLYVYDMGQEEASSNGNTDVMVFHGSVNAPVVDVVEIGKGAGTVIDNLTYGDYTGYLSLPTDDYILELRSQNGQDGIVAYSAPLQTLGLENAALVTVASGRLGNSDYFADFGLWVALPTGGDLIPLPEFTPGNARVQVIHNSADAAAEMVDVWLNDELLLDNFMFRTASPFVDVPTGINLNIAIQGPESTSAENPIWSNDYVLEDDMSYILVANGIVSGSGYSPATPFDIWVYDMGREEASASANTDILVFHGSTDAPTVDVVEIGAGAGTIINDLMYGDFEGYLELPTADYVLSITDAAGENSVVSYSAPLSTLGLDGAALVTVASGFLTPENNSNGEAFGLWVALPTGGDLIALPEFTPGNARVQVIHNSADAAAETVDVWLNGEMLIDDFMFRTATPFVDVPTGINLNIAIQGPGSTSAENPIWSNNYVLEDDMSYVLIANGIVSASGYSPATPFDIWVYAMGQEEAMTATNTDLLVFHGSTDAPTVDVVETGVGAGTIIDNLMYGDFAGYLELPTDDYILEIQDETGENTLISYSAPLATLGLEGVALVTVASGFLAPENNSDGSGFGLFAALPTGGDLVALPVHEGEALDMARVQVIHNSADAAAAVVDVWLNETLLLDDFTFRTASPFVDAPADEEFTISIKGPDSMDPNDPIWSMNYTLEAGETYVLVANGIVSAEGYDPFQPFDIYVYAGAVEQSPDPMKTVVEVFHGSTDAPTVDVLEVSAVNGTIIDDMGYGSFANTLTLDPMDYSLQIRDESGTVPVAQFSAPLETLGLEGAAIFVVASGFLAPENNSDGADFGLWVALPTGGELIALPAEEIAMARVQVIHNSADDAAEMVDVWLDNTLLLDDFMFRTASPFVDAPAGAPFRISIQGPESSSPMNPIWFNDYTLMDGETYVLIANGIVSGNGYDPVQPFDIYVKDMGREEATNMSNTDVMVFHGSTDAPTVDVVEVGVGAGTIVDDLSYGEYDGYLELGTADYRLAIKDESGQNTVATYDAPLSSLGLDGAAITVVASGFLNPSNNSNGENFGLWVALATGGDLVELPLWLSVREIIVENDVTAYPNPAVNVLNVQYSLIEDADVSVEVYDLLGNKVKDAQSSTKSNQLQTTKMDVSDLKTGLYFVTINAGENRVSKKIQVVN